MKRTPEIQLDTPLRPRTVAEAVWEEASQWLEQPLPRRWLRELIAEANTVYAHNNRFRRQLRASGDSGREWLWLFTRHWLAAFIHERRPHLHKQLPASYNQGEPLPEPRFLPPQLYIAADTVTRRKRMPVRFGESWALAAHSHT